MVVVVVLVVRMVCGRTTLAAQPPSLQIFCPHWNIFSFYFIKLLLLFCFVLGGRAIIFWLTGRFALLYLVVVEGSFRLLMRAAAVRGLGRAVRAVGGPGAGRWAGRGELTRAPLLLSPVRAVNFFWRRP